MPTLVAREASLEFGDVEQWIQTFSYPAVLLLLISAGLGAPVSEDLIMLAGGIVTAKTGGSLVGMMVTAFVGVLIGDSLLYRLGLSLGPRAVKLRWVRKLLTPERVAASERYFARYGAMTIFVVRFTMGLRAVTFLTAGMSGLRYRRFLLADALAAAIFVPTLVFLGWKFGAVVMQDVERAFGWILGAVVAAVLILAVVRMVRRRRRLRSPRTDEAGRMAAEVGRQHRAGDPI